jgi:hypothetical protein
MCARPWADWICLLQHHWCHGKTNIWKHKMRGLKRMCTTVESDSSFPFLIMCEKNARSNLFYFMLLSVTAGCSALFHSLLSFIFKILIWIWLYLALFVPYVILSNTLNSSWQTGCVGVIIFCFDDFHSWESLSSPFKCHLCLLKFHVKNWIHL